MWVFIYMSKYSSYQNEIPGQRQQSKNDQFHCYTLFNTKDKKFSFAMPFECSFECFDMIMVIGALT